MSGEKLLLSLTSACLKNSQLGDDGDLMAEERNSASGAGAILSALLLVL